MFPPAKLKLEGQPTSYDEDDGPPTKGDPSRPDLLGKGVTVGQLIAQLQQFPSAQRVMVRGYESGFDDPEPLQVITVQPDPFDSSVYGNYQDGETGGQYSFDVILIDRP